MARRVYFSFHYTEDIWRVGQVRNSWLLQKGETNTFMDAASWEAVKRKGPTAIKGWIDRQMDGTGVTVVLIGRYTAQRRYVLYEIEESHKRGNGLLGIYIHGIKNSKGVTSAKGQNPFDYLTTVAENWLGFKTTKRLSEIYPTYDWKMDHGRASMTQWIEEAAVRAGR